MKPQRDNGEQATPRDLVDWDTYQHPDHDQSDYLEDGPRVIPDHGAQPRIVRPSFVEWARDPANRYRPAESVEPRQDISAADLYAREKRLAVLLTKTARDHARKLAWRTDDAAFALIQSEVLPDAIWIAGNLPRLSLERVLQKFLDVLWDEIDKSRHITKM